VDFELNEEQTLVQSTARGFAEKVLSPRAAERDREGSFPDKELRELAGLGLMAVNITAELGGSESGALAYSLAIEEIARACASTSVAMAVTNMVGELVARFGTDAIKRDVVPRLASGQALAGAFALSEPQSGSDVAGMTTVARKHAGGWRVSGAKQWITSGDRAGVIVLWAKTDAAKGGRGVSAFVLPRGCETPGLSVGRHEDKMGMRGSSTVSLMLDEVEVEAGWMLGHEGEGMRIALTALDGGRIGIASQALGIGTAALEAAIAYARERKSFGVTLAEHQAIQFMLADAATELAAARLLVRRAAVLKEQGVPFTREASMAKLWASEAAGRACDMAVQVHGGYGYTKDFAVERLLRDVRVTRIYEGTSEIQRIVIARKVFEVA
jgi:alkylation response protein AidB-like acyl-CoA dehydrogenase